MPIISVIVTTYNRKEYLTETIQSILNQTYQDFELIVVDNFSNYDFFALMDGFKSEKIIPLQNQNNGIIAVNRNIGIKQAKGEYIAFCDDDDSWVKNKLQNQIDIINETKCDLVCSNMFLFKGDITNILKSTSNKRINNLKNLIDNNHVNTSSVLVKNEDLFFPEDPKLIAIEDYALWLNLCIKGFRFEFLPQPLVYFRISGMSATKKNSDKKHLQEIYLYASFLLSNPDLPIKIKVLTKIIMHFLKFSIKNIIFKN